MAARPDLEIEFGKETLINLLRPRKPPLDLGEPTPKSGSKGGGVLGLYRLIEQPCRSSFRLIPVTRNVGRYSTHTLKWATRLSGPVGGQKKIQTHT